MGLDRHVLNLRQSKLAFDHGRTLGPSRLNVALSQLKVLGNVAAGLGKNKIRNLILAKIGMKQRSTGLSALQGVKDCLQFFIIDSDLARRLLGYLLTGGNHSCDRFTDHPYPVSGKDRAVDQVQADIVGHICPGHHSLNAGHLQSLADIDLFDQCVGMRAAYQATIVQTRAELHVVSIDRTASDLFVGIHTGHALANGFAQSASCHTLFGRRILNQHRGCAHNLCTGTGCPRAPPGSPFCWLRIPLKQCCCRHQHTWRTKAALDSVVIHECLL